MLWCVCMLTVVSVTAADCIDAIVASRAALRPDYTLRIVVNSWYTKSPQSPKRRQSYEATLYRLGKKFRTDVTKTLDGADKTDPQTHVICENCEREGYVLTTDVFPEDPSVSHRVEFRDITKINIDYYGLQFDWRYFGTLNTMKAAYPRLSPLEHLTSLGQWPDSTVLDKKVDGKRCFVIRSVRPDDVTEVWLDVVDSYNPIRRTWAVTIAGSHTLHTTDVDWQTTPGGHRYPSRVHYTRLTEGVMDYDKTVTILSADFHNPVDPKLFTFGSLGLNELHELALPELDPSKYPHWRDGKVDYSYTPAERTRDAIADGRILVTPPVLPDADAPPLATGTYPTEGRFSATLVAGIVAGVLSLVTLVYAVVLRRRRAA